ncbi:MAG: efflux RND transporter periplasmic adaptor subunit [Acetobacteraceae bacterium]|nr:efflux RND transporter periplasmic adaptor subunit [Acetobacteraceae bacterium]
MNEIRSPLPPAAPLAGSPAPVRRRRRRWPWLLLLLLLGAGAGGFAWWRQGTPAPAPVQTVEVRRGDIADLVSSLGTVQPLRYVDVGVQVSGQITRLHVEVGDRVEAGQLLAELDARVVQARLAQNTAEAARLRALLAQQEASRDLATAQVQRQRTLAAANATSREALDAAEAQLRVIEAQILQTRAQIEGQEAVLANDRTTLSFTRVVAPMAGTVVSLTAVEGQTLNANQTTPIILRIADLSRMRVVAQVSEADQPRLAVGMPVRFHTLGRPERRYEARLQQIWPTPEVVNNVVLFSALFEVPNADGALLPQMSAQVFFVRAEARDVVLVPLAALSGPPRRQGGPPPTVQVQREDGTLETRAIRIGVTDRVNAEVLEGLSPGERVVLRTAPRPNAGRPPQGGPPQGGPGGGRP